MKKDKKQISFVITNYLINKRKSRVSLHAIVNGKKKYWNIPKGLFDVLIHFKEVKDTATNGS